MRNSKQRNLILQTLKENPVHPSADKVYEMVRKEVHNISLATVYRNLKQLSDEGIIKKIEGLDGSMHFDHTTCEHYHFVCKVCKNVYDIKSELIPKPDAAKFASIGIELDQYDINLKGVCPNCNNNKKGKQNGT